MKHIILFVLLIQIAQSSPLTLKKILADANDNNMLTQAIDQERLFLEARNLADTSTEPVELYGTGAKAYPVVGRYDHEYSVGLSKKLPWANTQKEDQMITRLNNEAYLLEEDKKVLNYQNGLKDLYHQYCLDHRNYKSFKQSYQELETLYMKKQKAYTYQEISKVELMQLQMEKNKYYAQLQEIKMIQDISMQKLFILGQIKHTEKTTLSCNDMYSIRENITLKEDTFQLSKQAYEKRIESTQVALKRHSKPLEDFSVSVQYDKEMDIDRYSVGVSIPLTFTSERSEQERVAALHKNSAIDFDHEQTMLEKKSMLTELKGTLKSNAVLIRSLKNNLHNYSKDLLPLMKKSYENGESSVIEYLLNRQNYHQLNQELLAAQKAYYHTLFTLYTLIESKDH